MNKFFRPLTCMMLFFIASVVQLNADDGISIVSSKNSTARFYVATPAKWKRVESIHPIDFKYVTKDGKFECFVMLNIYKDSHKIAKEDLIGDLIELCNVVFGKNFYHDESQYPVHYFKDDSDEVAAIGFRDLKFQKSIYSYAYKIEDGKRNGSVCLLSRVQVGSSHTDAELEAFIDNIVFAE